MTWGPFAPGLELTEVQTRLRVVRAIVRVLTGPRGDDLRHRLGCAAVEPGPDHLAAAEREFERLGSIDRRRILACYAAEAGA